MHWQPEQIIELKKLKAIYPSQIRLAEALDIHVQRMSKIYNEHEFFTVKQAHKLEELCGETIDASKLINPKFNYNYKHD